MKVNATLRAGLMGCAAIFGAGASGGAAAQVSFDVVSAEAIIATTHPLATALAGYHELGLAPQDLNALNSPLNAGYRTALQGLIIGSLSTLEILASSQTLPRDAAMSQLDVTGDGRVDLLDVVAVQGTQTNLDSARPSFRDISGTGFLSTVWDRIPMTTDRDISGTGFDLIIEATRLLASERDISGTGFELILDLADQVETRDISGTGFDVLLALLTGLNTSRDISGTGRIAADVFDILGQQIISAMNRLADDDVEGAGLELLLGYLAAAEMLAED